MHSSIRTTLAALALAAGTATPAPGAGLDPASDPTWPRFRDTFRELIETPTAISGVGCTVAAQRMAVRLLAAGYPQEDVRVFVPEGAPKDGGLVALLRGTDPAAPAILELAHIDVVEARRADWVRDPFTLIEQDGVFYGRGVVDMKMQAATWVDNLVRFRDEGLRPRRTIKLALTCGEEADNGVNGAQWLVEHDRAAIDAAFAVTEGLDGSLDANGQRVMLGIEAGEKLYQDFVLEATNKGGHSSRPRKDNAIYSLARALGRISAHEFPVQFIDANRAYFERMAPITGGEQGKAMKRLIANPRDRQATAVLDRNVDWHAMLRTTCVATMLAGGHATNALPQRATANVNCRIMPGVPVEQVRAELLRVIADPSLTLTPAPGNGGHPAPPPRLTPEVLEPIERIAADLWPGVPVVPGMEPGASDAVWIASAGIPTYGVTGLFTDPDGGNMHGLDEHVRVRSVVEGREFLYRLIKAYSQQ